MPLSGSPEGCSHVLWVQGGQQERAQGTRRAKTAEFVGTSLVRSADLAFGSESTSGEPLGISAG
jgi:hypothetical protein